MIQRLEMVEHDLAGGQPRSYARRLDALVEVSAAQLGGEPLELPSRPLWRVVHRSRRDIPTVRAVIDRLDELF